MCRWPRGGCHSAAFLSSIRGEPSTTRFKATTRTGFRSGDAAFDFILNRHEAFAASEVARVLAPGGRFLTQQAGSGPDQLHALLGLRAQRRPAFDLDLLVGQAVRAGLAVEDARAGNLEKIRFADVGALAWYLRMVPWAVPGCDVTSYRQALEAATARGLGIDQERFLRNCRR